MSELEPTGILPDKYDDLQTSPEVEWAVGQRQRAQGEQLPNQPEARIGAYLGSLVGRHGLLGGSEERKQAQIAARVMKPEDIPESYFEYQAQIARERGHGQVEHQLREQVTEAVIADQTASLETWVDYINSNDAGYPAWFRYYALRNVLKLSSFDKEKGKFRSRSQGTVSPYPDLNREALAYVYDGLADRRQDREANDDSWGQLLAGANFNKLYSHALGEVAPANPENLETTAGEWVKYEQGWDQAAKQRAHRLAESLAGHGTGWCTAGAHTAETQLAGGDFYVYYSYDESGEATVPRVAVRMGRDQVAEVRGIRPDQNLEPEMSEIVQQQLADLPGGETYFKKVEDMRRLTEIEAKLEDNGDQLGASDLRFLYEIDDKIEGFGYGRDPRIEQLRDRRDTRADLAQVLDLPEAAISLTNEEALSGGIEYHYGDLQLPGRDYFAGRSVDLPRQVSGSVFGGAESYEELRLPAIIGDYLDLRSLTSAENLTLPQEVGGFLELSGLTSAEGLSLPQKIGGTLGLNGLTSAEGLEFPQEVGGHLDLRQLTSAENLTLPQEVGGHLRLDDLTFAEGLELPQEVGGELRLDNLTSAEGLELPREVGGTLWLYSLISAKNLELPREFGGSLELSGLTSAEGLELPQEVSGSINLSSLTSAEGLELPQKIGSYLNLGRLTTAEGLELPQEVGGDLELSGLTSVEGLSLPQKIGGNLWFNSLTTAEGLVLPDKVGGSIVVKDLPNDALSQLRSRYPDLDIRRM